MKKKSIIKALFCLAFMFVLIFANPVTVDTSHAASGIKISKSKMTLCVEESQRLKVTGTSKKVTWASSNKKVARVSSKGKVSGLKPGTATITAKVAGKTLKSKVTVRDDIGTYYIVWNVNTKLSPAGKKLSEKEAAEVRYAINLLIDRTYIAKNIVGGGMEPASTLVAKGITEPDGSQFYKHAGPRNAGYYPLKGKKSKALGILKKYYTVSNGKVTDFPAIEYIYNVEGGIHGDIAKYLQSRLKSVGIKLTITGYDWDEFSTKLKNGKFDLARMGWIADANDANNFLEMSTTGNSNNYSGLGKVKHASASVYKVKLKGIGRYKNLSGTWKNTYNKLNTYIKKTKNEEVRCQLMHKAEDLLMETGCICPLYYYTK